MKTFLWTTLFRIVAVIAWLLCLGFGNLWTQVLDNGWIAKFLPQNIQTVACEPIIDETLKWIDRCEQAQEAECNLVTAVETWDLQGIQASIEALLSWQALMYDEMKESLKILDEKVGWVNSTLIDGVNSEQQIAAQNEQKKKELTADIEKAVAEKRYQDAAELQKQLEALN